MNLNSMEQLIAFVDYERKHNPGRVHVADFALQEIERLRAAAAATDDQCVPIYMGLHVSQFRRLPPSVQAMWLRGQTIYESRIASINRTREPAPLAIDANDTQSFGGRRTQRQSRIDLIGQNGGDGEHYNHLEK